MKRTPLKRKTPLMSGPPRKTRVALTCKTCGKEFEVSALDAARGRKYCSQACMGRAQRATRKCIVCGSEFNAKGGAKARKTCSRACHIEAVRRSKLGKKNPAYRAGGAEARRRWRSAKESFCRVCNATGVATHLHHVVYEQHVRHRGGDVFDPDNSLTVCLTCHFSHHAGEQRIPLTCLREENITFARALLGEYADDYFARFYDDGNALFYAIGQGGCPAVGEE